MTRGFAAECPSPRCNGRSELEIEALNKGNGISFRIGDGGISCVASDRPAYRRRSHVTDFFRELLCIPFIKQPIQRNMRKCRISQHFIPVLKTLLQRLDQQMIIVKGTVFNLRKIIVFQYIERH